MFDLSSRWHWGISDPCYLCQAKKEAQSLGYTLGGGGEEAAGEPGRVAAAARARGQ